MRELFSKIVSQTLFISVCFLMVLADTLANSLADMGIRNRPTFLVKGSQRNQNNGSIHDLIWCPLFMPGLILCVYWGEQAASWRFWLNQNPETHTHTLNLNLDKRVSTQTCLAPHNTPVSPCVASPIPPQKTLHQLSSLASSPFTWPAHHRSIPFPSTALS